mmetsp:Transcript_21721/g.43182  ORF Transcript_21721/g.43182 Transcript_21721/m.43182 type:complete len:116 (-) Transcript_21721:13-360(-)
MAANKQTEKDKKGEYALLVLSVSFFLESSEPVQQPSFECTSPSASFFSSLNPSSGYFSCFPLLYRSIKPGPSSHSSSGSAVLRERNSCQSSSVYARCSQRISSSSSVHSHTESRV